MAYALSGKQKYVVPIKPYHLTYKAYFSYDGYVHVAKG